MIVGTCRSFLEILLIINEKIIECTFDSFVLMQMKTTNGSHTTVKPQPCIQGMKTFF